MNDRGQPHALTMRPGKSGLARSGLRMSPVAGSRQVVPDGHSYAEPQPAGHGNGNEAQLKVTENGQRRRTHLRLRTAERIVETTNGSLKPDVVAVRTSSLYVLLPV